MASLKKSGYFTIISLYLGYGISKELRYFNMIITDYSSCASKNTLKVE